MTRKTQMKEYPNQEAAAVGRKIYDHYYPLEYLRKHPALADRIIREYERDHGPLPKIRLHKNKRSHAKKKTDQA